MKISMAPTSVFVGEEERGHLMGLHNAYVTAACQTVGEMTDCLEERRICNYLQRNGVAATIKGDQVIALEPNKGIKPFRVVCLRECDVVNPCAGIQEFLNEKKIYAEFRVEIATLLIKAWIPMSRIWKGAMVLHESFHADTLLSCGDRYKDPAFYYPHERDAWNLQTRVVRQAKGPKYVELVERIAAETIADIGKRGLDPKMTFLQTIAYPVADMNALFGEPRSPQENGYRETHLMVDVQFEIIERVFAWDTSESRRAEYIKYLQETHPNNFPEKG